MRLKWYGSSKVRLCERFLSLFEGVLSEDNVSRMRQFALSDDAPAAVNACLDWRRQEKRRQKLLNDWAEFDEDRTPGTDGETAQDELSKEVQAALMKLAAKQRAAIVLTVYGGHNHAEAAKSLGCSETTVSWRIFSARRKLKKLLSKKGGIHE